MRNTIKSIQASLNTPSVTREDSLESLGTALRQGLLEPYFDDAQIETLKAIAIETLKNIETPPPERPTRGLWSSAWKLTTTSFSTAGALHDQVDELINPMTVGRRLIEEGSFLPEELIIDDAALGLWDSAGNFLDSAVHFEESIANDVKRLPDATRNLANLAWEHERQTVETALDTGETLLSASLAAYTRPDRLLSLTGYLLDDRLNSLIGPDEKSVGDQLKNLNQNAQSLLQGRTDISNHVAWEGLGTRWGLAAGALGICFLSRGRLKPQQGSHALRWALSALGGGTTVAAVETYREAGMGIRDTRSEGIKWLERTETLIKAMLLGGLASRTPIRSAPPAMTSPATAPSPVPVAPTPPSPPPPPRPISTEKLELRPNATHEAGDLVPRGVRRRVRRDLEGRPVQVLEQEIRERALTQAIGEISIPSFDDMVTAIFRRPLAKGSA